MINTQNTTSALSIFVGDNTSISVSNIYKRIQVLWESNQDPNRQPSQTFPTFQGRILDKEIKLLITYPGFPTIIDIDPKGMPIFQWTANPSDESNTDTFYIASLGKEKILYAKPEIAQMASQKQTRQAFATPREMELVFAHFKEFLSAKVPTDSYLYSCHTHAAWMSYMLLHFFKVDCEECYVEPQEGEKLTPSPALFPRNIPSGWYYHVAVQVACQNGSNTEIYILDPTLEEPVLRSRWINGLKGPTGMREITFSTGTKWKQGDILDRIAFARDVLICLCDRYKAQ